MFNRFFYIPLSLFVLASCSFKPEPKNFAPSLPDVPLPKGFEVDPVTQSFFDSPEGRIAEMYAVGFKTPEDVTSFYSDNLPTFGWKQIDDKSYVKDGESLNISTEKGNYLTTVKYQLKPSAKAR